MPKVNTAYTFDVSLVSQADTKVFQANPTLAAGDVKVSIDEGALTNLATLPTVTPASGRNVKVSLSAAEMNGSRIVVQFVDAAGAEWCEQMIAIETSPDDLTIANISDGLLDKANGVETGYTLRQALRLIASVICGKVTEAGGTWTFRNLPDAANRVVATTSGNSRTGVTHTP